MLNFFSRKKKEKKEPSPSSAYTRFVRTIGDNPVDVFENSLDDSDFLVDHVPNQQLSYVHQVNGQWKTMTEKETVTALTAARIDKSRTYRQYLVNPMQNVDYRFFEAQSKHTFIGSLADAYVKFLIGDGFKPELELINPDAEDKEKNSKEIKDNQEIITRLLQIDAQIGMPESDGDSYDISFSQKIAALITSCLIYNRGALIFNHIPGHTITIDGIPYPEIPNNLIFAHARDLGIIETDPYTRKLKAVQYQYDTTMIPIKEMIYLWNPITSAKVYNSWHYGYSMIAPMMSAAKLIRKLLGESLPAMSDVSWTGHFFLVVKNDGATEEEKEKEFADITKNIRPGKAAVLVRDPEEVNVHTINLDPKVNEFRDLLESMIRLCISIIGLPQVGFYDESASNRDTMAGKVQLTIQTNIDPMRRWIGEAIAAQWYNRWFRLIYKDDPKILKKFRIKVSWTDLHIVEWYDNIEALLALAEKWPLKLAAAGKMMHIDNFEGDVDMEALEEQKKNEEKERQQAMSMGQGMQQMGKGGNGFGGRNATGAPSSMGNAKSKVQRKGKKSVKSVGRQRQSPL